MLAVDDNKRMQKTCMWIHDCHPSRGMLAAAVVAARCNALAEQANIRSLHQVCCTFLLL
jgi:hypothetical protein